MEWIDFKEKTPLNKVKGNAFGWYAVSINPVNWRDFEDDTKLNSWREEFGFTKAWYMNGEWFEADFHDYGSNKITDRVTHWAELPKVPLYKLI